MGIHTSIIHSLTHSVPWAPKMKQNSERRSGEGGRKGEREKERREEQGQGFVFVVGGKCPQ